MSTLTSCRALVLLSWLVWAGFTVAGPPLAYRFPADSRIHLVSSTHIDAPVVGAIDAAITSEIHVVSSGAAGVKTAQEITSRSPGHPDYHLSLGCRISPVGQVTEVTGIDSSDPTQALIAKNLAVGLPALPNTAVSVGSTWGTEKPFYLPKVSVPGVPAVLRVRSTYQVTDIGVRRGVRTATIDVTVVESPGQSTKVKASGTWVLDHDTGRPISGAIRGEAKIRIAFVPTSCPFRLDVASR